MSKNIVATFFNVQWPSVRFLRLPIVCGVACVSVCKSALSDVTVGKIDRGYDNP